VAGLSLRQLLPGWIGLCLLAAIAWTATIRWTNTMNSGPGTMGLSLGGFLAVWVVMMAAMMLPSVAPMALVWIRSVSARSRARDRAIGTTSFLAGYLVAWTAFGAVVYVALWEVGRLVTNSPGAVRWMGAGIFAAAGVYQLTAWKGRCLRHCRTPLGSLFHYASYRGPARDLRVGVHHGLYCVGCCWGLMIVLIAVGAMNIAVMVALSGVILIEKVWRHGEGFSRVVGVTMFSLAALVLFFPSLLIGLTTQPMPGM